MKKKDNRHFVCRDGGIAVGSICCRVQRQCTVKMKCFPQRSGEYQNISEEYVQSCIGQAKE